MTPVDSGLRLEAEFSDFQPRARWSFYKNEKIWKKVLRVLMTENLIELDGDVFEEPMSFGAIRNENVSIL